MIVGIGTDLVDSRRVAGMLLCHEERAVRKLMTPTEVAFYRKRGAFALGFAKVFAAKEAVVKAIGTIITFSWHDIEIGHYDNGCPFVTIHGDVQAALMARIIGLVPRPDTNNVRTHISFADEPPYVSAVCVIEYIA
ncbi:MAG: holo-ACP synthase [Holosporales bacterium]|jgi:holo-[acyl-carrier protein] synthase|nr:holo-ACP synthase [Holosporales bacterium]